MNLLNQRLAGHQGLNGQPKQFLERLLRVQGCCQAAGKVIQTVWAIPHSRRDTESRKCVATIPLFSKTLLTSVAYKNPRGPSSLLAATNYHRVTVTGARTERTGAKVVCHCRTTSFTRQPPTLGPLRHLKDPPRHATLHANRRRSRWPRPSVDTVPTCHRQSCGFPVAPLPAQLYVEYRMYRSAISMEATDQGKHARLRHGIPEEYGKNPTPPPTSSPETVIENQWLPEVSTCDK